MVVLNSNNPDAVLIGLGVGGVMQSPGVRAADVAEMDVASFVAHLGRMGTLLLLQMQLYGLLVTKSSQRSSGGSTTAGGWPWG